MRRGGSALIVGALSTSVLMAQATTEAVPDPRDRTGRLLVREWVSAVVSHTPGVDDPPVREISRWSRDDFQRATPYLYGFLELLTAPSALVPVKPLPGLDDADTRQVHVLALAHRSAGPDGPNPFLHRAALLHSDVALLELSAPEAFRPVPGQRLTRPRRGNQQSLRLLVRGPDGAFAGLEFRPFHWQLARELLDLVSPTPADDPFVARWYRATASSLADSYNFAEALPHLERARVVAGADPFVHLASGCLLETLASPPVQAFVRRTVLPGGLQLDGMESQETTRRRAGEAYARAIELNPGLVEARLRQIRVASDGTAADTLASLGVLVPTISDAHLRFLGELFLGDAAEHAEQFETARAAYERATRLFPTASSAWLALSALARRTGDGPVASSALARAISVPPERPDRGDDPWSTYYRCEGRTAESLLAELRAPYRPN